jgi:hypothetical protein
MREGKGLMASGKLRFSRRIISHLEGSQAWADAWAMRHGGSRTQSSDIELMWRLFDAPRRKDGSRVIEVTGDDLDYLESSIGAMEAGAADNLGYTDDGNDALADHNAARAMLRAMTKVRAIS